MMVSASLSVLPLLAAPQLVGVEQAYLVPSTGGLAHQFGGEVAVEGDTAFVGTNWASIPGSVYVFERSGGAWMETQQLAPGNGKKNDYFGQSIDIDGDTAVIGAWAFDGLWPTSGAAYVFVHDGSSWNQTQRLSPSDPVTGHGFGISVAIEGDTIAVCAPWDNDIGPHAGAVYMFERAGGFFSETAELHGSDTGLGDHFGRRLALEGDTLLAASPTHDHAGQTNRGSAFVFVRTPGGWVEQAELVDPAGVSFGLLGDAADLSGDLAILGAQSFKSTPTQTIGAAHVFTRAGTTWTHEAQLLSPAPTHLGKFGLAVAIEGELALVSEPWNDEADPADSSCNSGSVHFFTRSGGVWTPQSTYTAVDLGCGDELGSSVALSSGTIVTGAQRDDPIAFASGSAYVFEVESASPASYCTAGTSASGCAATLSAAGAVSATAPSGFVLSAAGVEGTRNGMFLYGANGRAMTPWGNGSSLRCVAPPTKSGGVQLGTGTAGACEGAFNLDLNARWCPTCPRPGHNPGLGATVQAQLWYRDPLTTSNQTTGWSDAIEFTVGL